MIPMHITDYLRSILKRLRHVARPNPMRDWFALLALASVALVGIVVWNVWAFKTVADGGSIGAPAAKTSSATDQSMLNAVHELLQNRAAEEAKYATGVYRYTDPSH